MFLRNVKLKNFMQHRDLEKEIQGNLICVCGRNGAGKSNFFGGLQFALTGEYPPWKKADLVSWNEKDGYVDLQFDDNGKSCEIVRNILKSDVTLTFGDSEISGATKVAEAMDSMLNVDKDLFKQVVFVRQKELDSILFTEPRQRELAFQKLMGIGDADKIYKQLGEVLTSYGKADFDEQIQEQKARLEEAESAVSMSEEAIKTINQALEGSSDENSVMASIKELSNQVRTWEALKDKIDQFNTASQKLANFRWSDVDNTLEGLNEADLVEKKALLEHQKAILKEWETLSTELETVHSRLKELALEKAKCLSTEDLDDLREQSEKLSHDLSQAEGEEKALRKFSVAEGTTICPLCGSHTDKDIHQDLEDRILALRVSELRHESAEMKTRLAGETDRKARVQAEIDKLLPKHESITSRLAKIDEQYPELDTTRTSESMDAEILELSRTITRLKAYLSKKESEASTRKLLENSVSQLQNEVGLNTVEQCLANIKSLEDQQNAIWDELRKTQELRKSLAEYTGAVQSTRKMVDDLKTYISNLEEKKKANDDIMARADIVQNVRNWFHYSNGPRTISTNVMARLNADVNRFLGEFTAPFVVVPQEEGVGFKVRFTDGRPMPQELPDASVLSGGQKVMLAVAFRLATYCTFANKLGLLVLDEPTAYLDDANIECFGELMSKISEIAKNLNLQILLATHERSILSLFSSTIEL